MSLFLDKKYAGMLSGKLERFKWKDKNTAEFRCPQCGDSKKSKTKCRGGFYSLKDTLMVGCFNCGYAKPFGMFLKTFDPVMYKEYMFEKFKYDNDHKWFHKRLEKQEEKAKQTYPLLPVCMVMGLHQLISIKNLPADHIAKRYIMDRKIPFQFWDKLYYTENFKKWINEKIDTKKFIGATGKDPRIVIPFLNKDNTPFAYTGRAITNEQEQRYISINPDRNNLLLYGIERLKDGLPIYATEGQIDSLFIRNGIAAGGSSLSKLFKFKKLDIIFCFDNESRSKEICELLENVIKLGKKVIIWDKKFKNCKDINDIIIKYNLTQDELMVHLEERTFQGLTAQIKYNEWKKI